jgi:hypothetical protein
MEGYKVGGVDEEIAHLKGALSSPVGRSTIFGQLAADRVLRLEDVRDTRYFKASPIEVASEPA